MKIKTVLTIAGSDSCCGAGIQADLKTFAKFGVYGTSAVTAVTSQNPRAITDIHYIPPHSIVSQIDAVANDFQISAAKIGMLGASEAVEAVAVLIKKYKIKYIVLDPIIKSSSGVSFLFDDAIELLKKKLLPLSFIITPNITEAEILSGISISGIKDMREAAKLIYTSGGKNVLITGGHLPDEPVDILYDGKKFHTFTTERVNTKMHGTGCILSSAIAAGLSKGKKAHEAVAQAKNYIYTALKDYSRITCKEPSANNSRAITAELQKAVDILKQLKIGALIPEVQSNIVYALPDAKDPGGVAALPGRIIKVDDEIYTISPPAMGSSRHISAIVLTAMKYDRSKRAAMNIKYNRKIISICRKLKLKAASFDRTKEPKNMSKKEGFTLEWGTESVIKRKGFVPDIIYDRGAIGKEPMVRIIAHNPMALVRIIKKIKNQSAK